jgi:hypothetical protein
MARAGVPVGQTRIIIDQQPNALCTMVKAEAACITCPSGTFPDFFLAHAGSSSPK